MSIGSIGSLRGALGTVDTQPSPFTPRLRVQAPGADANGGAEQAAQTDAPVGATGSGSAISSTPWAPWPAFVPLPPDRSDGGTEPTREFKPLPAEQPSVDTPPFSPLPPEPSDGERCPNA